MQHTRRRKVITGRNINLTEKLTTCNMVFQMARLRNPCGVDSAIVDSVAIATAYEGRQARILIIVEKDAEDTAKLMAAYIDNARESLATALGSRRSGECRSS
jgi:hypothetical protein